MKSFVTIILIISLIIFTFYQTLFEGFYHSRYEDYGSSKVEKLPLIEPYAIFGSSDYYKYDWMTQRELIAINFDSVDGMNNYDENGDLWEIDSFGIINDLILFHCKEFNYGKRGSHWLIFNSAKARGVCCKSEIDFRKRLKNLGYLNIKLYNPDSVYKEFAVSHKMPPEWKKYEEQEHKKYWWIIRYWFH